MAISATHFELTKQLYDTGAISDGASVLQIGEANLYGDFDVSQIVSLLSDDRLIASYRLALENQDAYALAKLAYKALFKADVIVSIDAGGQGAMRLDLNNPLELGQQYDLCVNHGTAEHIFDIGNVFRTMHAHTRVGGLMIHESPFTGWIDHGFYCLQPTLFWDVAAVNQYEVVLCALEHLASKTYGLIESREQILELKRCDRLADNLMIFIALRKTTEATFVVPTQGVYAGRISQQAEKSWQELR